jgi:uncharacterized protein YkwD
MERVRYILIALAVALLTLFAAPILLVTVTADPPDPTPQPVEEWSPGDPLILVGPLAYPPDPTSDLPWSAGTSGVADIQIAFNNARAAENTQLGTSIPMLTLPSQAEWDAKSNGEKALWLINRERIDRGVYPLHGLETNVTSVAQDYAEYLIDHNAFSHDADGRDPWERLNDNPAIGACHDFLTVAENLTAFGPVAPASRCRSSVLSTCGCMRARVRAGGIATPSCGIPTMTTAARLARKVFWESVGIADPIRDGTTLR